MNNNILNSSGKNITAIIFLLIFFGIIILLIIVAFIGSAKDKRERLVKNSKNRALMNEAQNSRVLIFSSLNKLINNLEFELKDFKPSVGTKSLGDINKEYLDIIKIIKDSDEIKSIYKSEDFKNELSPIIDDLLKSKPSNWTKESSFAISLIKAKFNAIFKNQNFINSIKEGESKLWN